MPGIVSFTNVDFILDLVRTTCETDGEREEGEEEKKEGGREGWGE